MAPREPSGRRERDRERDRDVDRDLERERRRERDRDRDGDRDRRPRYPQPDDEEYHQQRRLRQHRRQESRGDSENTPNRAHRSEKRRSSRRPATLSAEALATLEHENRHNARREERAARSRPHRDEYREVRVEKERPTERRAKKNKKRRHASGAILEEGRGWAGLRGGASTDEYGTEKELLHRGKKVPFWKQKKRLRELAPNAISSQGSG
jgi:hypothetical protein